VDRAPRDPEQLGLGVGDLIVEAAQGPTGAVRDHVGLDEVAAQAVGRELAGTEAARVEATVIADRLDVDPKRTGERQGVEAHGAGRSAVERDHELRAA
jgi:hypothetical protein